MHPFINHSCHEPTLTLTLCAQGADRPQTLLFSATVPPWVRSLAKSNLVNPHDVDLVGNSKLKVAISSAPQLRSR